MDTFGSQLVLSNVYFDAPIFILMLFFICCSAFFSMSETAFSSVSIVRLRLAVEDRKSGAKKAIQLTENFDRTLTTLLVGNNIVQTLMSFLSALLFYNLCAKYGLGSGVEAILSTVVMAFLVYIVSDTCPKILSKAIPNRMAVILAYPVTFVYFLLYPIIMIFKGILWCVHKLFKVKDTNLLSKEDLINSMSVAINDETNNVDEKEEQLFENDEKEIVDNIFVFDTLKVENVYTPNDKVLSLDISTLTIEKLNKVISNTTFSRIPIYDEVDDNIIGILVVKTYFEEYIKDPHLDIRSILLKPIYVDINDNIDDVFKELNKEKTHLGIVTKDNKMIGIISMEDILEELVEDIDEIPQTNKVNIHG